MTHPNVHVRVEAATPLRFQRCEVSFHVTEQTRSAARSHRVAATLEIHAQHVLQEKFHHEIREQCLADRIGSDALDHLLLATQIRRALFEKTPGCNLRKLSVEVADVVRKISRVQQAHDGMTRVGWVQRREDERSAPEPAITSRAMPQSGAVGVGPEDVGHAELQMPVDPLNGLGDVLSA